MIELASEEVRAAHARDWKINYDKEQAKKKAEEAGEEYVEEEEEMVRDSAVPEVPEVDEVDEVQVEGEVQEEGGAINYVLLPHIW